MIQRPDLFAVALPAVGVLDMLRYHQFSAGPFWAEDYGSADDPQAVDYLLAYSPLHNLKAGNLLSGDADHHRGPRRPRRAEPLVQVRGGAAEGTGLRPAGADPH